MFPASGDERFSRLPKWARDAIIELERRYASASLAAAEWEKPVTDETDAYVVGFTRPNTALPARPCIRFRIGQYHEEYIDVRFDFGGTRSVREVAPIGLSIMAGSSLSILPLASNVVVAKCEMRRDRVASRALIQAAKES